MPVLPRPWLAALVASLIAAPLTAQGAGLVPTVATHAQPAPRVLPVAQQPLARRILPLAGQLAQVSAWRKGLRDHADMQALAAARAARVRAPIEASAACPATCLAQSWLWTPEDIDRFAAALRHVGQDKVRLAALVQGVMRPSHAFARYEALDDLAMLEVAWRDTAAGLNHSIRVYGMGEAPHYPVIDSIIFNPQDPAYANLLQTHSLVTLAEAQPTDQLLDPTLRYAMGLLAANERTHAAQYLPLSSGLNQQAFAMLAAQKHWAYPYSAILVFGHGPEDPLSHTGVLGHVRLRLAAAQWARGQAPVIILSGGRVHPNRTEFNEAVEMRRELIELYGVPPAHIVIEPHARHTTTNLRNCARLLLSAPFAQGKPALIVTDPATHGYIGGPVLAERNRKELGYEPGQISAGPDALSLRFLPDRLSFHVDPTEPLDP